MLISVALILVPQVALAQLGHVVCDDRDRLEAQLFGTNGAVRQGRGMRGPDALFEVWIEPKSGDWTLIQSYPNGTSCILAMGEHWENFELDLNPT